MRKLSIVIPVYNESENIKPLYDEIISVVEDFELIIVDDGSTDSTWDVIKEIAQKDKRVIGIRFTRNFGQTQAIKAGIEIAKNDIIILMDGDGQNDPSDIPKLLSKIDEGFDVVSGWRKNRKDNYFTRILPSKIANFIISFITGVKLNDYGCTLKAYKKEFIKRIDLYGEMHRFIPSLCYYTGARIAEIEVNHRSRIRGRSKYGFGRIFKVILDVIVVKFTGSFMSKPIYFFGSFSFALIGISAIFFLITLYNKWYNHIFVKDQPLFLVAIFLSLVGVELALIGVIAEMITRTYYSITKKDFFIKERINYEER